MNRFVDAAAVLLLTAAMLVLGFHAWRRPSTPSATAAAEPHIFLMTFEERVARSIPLLEAHAAAGSWKTRAGESSCSSDSRRRLAELDAIEDDLLGTSRRALVDASLDPSVALPLANALDALRTCVACTGEKRGCAEAARALTRLESRLGLARSVGGT